MSAEEAHTQRNKLYGVPFAIAVIMVAFLALIYFNPSLQKFTLTDFDTLVKITYVVVVIMLVWLAIWKITLSTEVAGGGAPVAPARDEESEEEEVEPPKPPAPKKGAGPEVATKRGEDSADRPPRETEMPEGLRSHDKEAPEEPGERMRVVNWPKKEIGAFYCDVPLRVDRNMVLNLRSLLGRVCTQCEELEDCKRRVGDKLDHEVFEWNVECKDGLKRELQRARKRRDEKAKADAARDMVESKAKASASKGKAKGSTSKGKAKPKKATGKGSKSKKGASKSK